jgi:hypothetical protein
LLVSLTTVPALGATLDTDDASRSAYADGWDSLDDGSLNDGLGGWVFGGSATTGTTAVIASSASNGGATTIDTAGASFGLLDNGNEFVDVFRFLDDGDLLPGQNLSMDLDVNFRGGFKGIRVRGADDTTSIFRFEIGNDGGGDDYIVYDAATGNGSVGDAYSDDTIFNIELAQTSETGGTWTVTRSGGVTDLDTGTYTGSVSSFQLYSTNAGSIDTAEQAIYYNNIAVTGVVPEPGAMALLGLGGLAVCGCRRRERTH